MLNAVKSVSFPNSVVGRTMYRAGSAANRPRHSTGDSSSNRTES